MEKVQRFSIDPLPSHIPCQDALFVTTDEPELRRHYHPKSIAYLRVHSWCCVFCRFGEMCNDMYLSPQYHTEWFHCLVVPFLVSPVLLPPPPGNKMLNQ